MTTSYEAPREMGCLRKVGEMSEGTQIPQDLLGIDGARFICRCTVTQCETTGEIGSRLLFRDTGPLPPPIVNGGQCVTAGEQIQREAAEVVAQAVQPVASQQLPDAIA